MRRMDEGPEKAASDLRKLSDPEFIAHWAAVRHRLVVSHTHDPERAGIQRRYDDVLAEYRRRMEGRR
jgi:hypothetical protein